MFASLLRNLEMQRELFKDEVEILVRSDNGEVTTGEKRNWLYQNAKGKYVCSVDDDDSVPDYYIEEILRALKPNPDAVAMNGTITTNGKFERKWFISKNNPYTETRQQGEIVYLRFHNHLSPVRKSIATKFPFPDKSMAEDYEFALAMHKSGLIKTETIIKKPMYHYKFITNK